MNKNMLAQIKTIDSKAAGPGQFEAILSVPVPDRDGEVVDAKAFDPLPARINIDINHEMLVEKTVGSGVPYYDGDLLKIKGTFASTQLGQDVRTLVTEGHIDSLSVAYMDAVYEVDKKDGLPHLRKAKLLNAGIVSIPANEQALITASKAYAAHAVELAEAVIGTKAGARHSTSDYAHIQAAHDALAALGAECTSKSPAPADEPVTETDAKAAAPTDSKSPAAPAHPAVDVAALTARARQVAVVAAARLR